MVTQAHRPQRTSHPARRPAIARRPSRYTHTPGMIRRPGCATRCSRCAWRAPPPPTSPSAVSVIPLIPALPQPPFVTLRPRPRCVRRRPELGATLCAAHAVGGALPGPCRRGAAPARQPGRRGRGRGGRRRGAGIQGGLFGCRDRRGAWGRWGQGGTAWQGCKPSSRHSADAACRDVSIAGHSLFTASLLSPVLCSATLPSEQEAADRMALARRPMAARQGTREFVRGRIGSMPFTPGRPCGVDSCLLLLLLWCMRNCSALVAHPCLLPASAAAGCPQPPPCPLDPSCRRRRLGLCRQPGGCRGC